MAKISTEDRYKYLEKISPYKTVIDGILNREQSIVQLVKKDPETAAYKRLTLVEEMLNLASYYIIINGVSQSVLKVKKFPSRF